MSEIFITNDTVNLVVKVRNDSWGIDVEIPTVDFAIITVIYLDEGVLMSELILGYQEQFEGIEYDDGGVLI